MFFERHLDQCLKLLFRDEPRVVCIDLLKCRLDSFFCIEHLRKGLDPVSVVRARAQDCVGLDKLTGGQVIDKSKTCKTTEDNSGDQQNLSEV